MRVLSDSRVNGRVGSRRVGRSRLLGARLVPAAPGPHRRERMASFAKSMQMCDSMHARRAFAIRESLPRSPDIGCRRNDRQCALSSE